MNNIYFAQCNFEPSYINSITGRPYDDFWILLKLVNDDSFYIINGNGGSDLFSL